MISISRRDGIVGRGAIKYRGLTKIENLKQGELLLNILFTKTFLGKNLAGKLRRKKIRTTVSNFGGKISAGKNFGGMIFGQHFQ